MVVTGTEILRAMRHKFIRGYTDVVFKSMKEDIMRCFPVYGRRGWKVIARRPSVNLLKQLYC